MFVLVYNEHITDWRKGLLLMNLFEIMAAMEDLKRAKVFASMAYVAFEICEGVDVSLSILCPICSDVTYDSN
jgi:hypothetical protein